MQQLGETLELSGKKRNRVVAVVETLAALRGAGENLAEVAHDARNMVTALGLYCDLLEEPGVLAPLFRHYGGELRLVSAASRRLVEKLVALDSRELQGIGDGSGLTIELGSGERAKVEGMENRRQWEQLPAMPVNDLAAELERNRNLLASLAGPSISVNLHAEGGALPVRLTGEDLTRILVNLVKNAAESLTAGGRIALCLHEFHAEAEAAPWLVLTVDDSGPGIPAGALEKVFEAGYSTKPEGAAAKGGWTGTHRGLGLSIVRSILEAAGGLIHAANRDPVGTRFVIELPVRSR